MEDKCHLCGAGTNYFCADCDEPVCEDCCVPFTQFNLIERTLCQCCYDTYEAQDRLDYRKEEEREEKKKAEKEKRNKKSREIYWKPENVKKRCIANKQKRKEE